MSTIAIIPARIGSVRIPRKNLRMFHGKPIICYSIETALESGLFDAVYVSTDSDEIAAIAEAYGARILMRPPCDGTKGTQELAGEILRTMPYVDIACVIYATAPMMTAKYLHRGFDLLTTSSYAMSVGQNPLCDAAQFYWGHAKCFKERVPLITYARMVPINAQRVCDINTPEDWARAEQMYLALKGQS